MKRFAFSIGLAAALAASCSLEKDLFEMPQQEDLMFYASFEQPAEGTRVYANEKLYLRWTADDRVSIFNKNTYNQQYRFTGDTGANAGGFKKVDTDEFMTGNPMANVVSVYPYQESTAISEEGVLSLTLPAEQHYAENTFGLGANTMVSVTADNFLQYKNVGGYLRFSLYGKDVLVYSITLKGNNGEKLAGKAAVTMPLDETPTVELAENAGTEITLVCDTPVLLGATAEESVDFWFVVPPVVLANGFTVSIDRGGSDFEKTTDKTIVIERNKLAKMAPMEVERYVGPDRILYYTSIDGQIVEPKDSTVFGANILSNEYVGGKGILIFDGKVESIGDYAFYGRSTLRTIDLGSSVTSIGSGAFQGCTYLYSIDIPDSVLSIGNNALADCGSVHIGANVSSISSSAISPSKIRQLVVSERNTTYDSRDDCNSLIETATNTLIRGGKDSTIPEGVQVIGQSAFSNSNKLTIVIPSTVVLIKENAFSYYNDFKTVYCYPAYPPELEFQSFFTYWHPFYTSFMWSYQTTIYVPSEYYQRYVNQWGKLYSVTLLEMEPASDGE